MMILIQINYINSIYLQAMDNLWSIFEEESIFIPEYLKLILSVTNYDNLFNLERFTKDDKKKLKISCKTLYI